MSSNKRSEYEYGQCEAFLRDFVSEWFHFGKKQYVKFDVDTWDRLDDKQKKEYSMKYIYRFISYWVAFTALLDREYGSDYILEDGIRRHTTSDDKVTEHDRINLFFDDSKYSNAVTKEVLLSYGKASFFAKQKLHKMVRGKEKYPFDTEYDYLRNFNFEEKNKNEIKKCNRYLLTLVYQVRNNLIHGHKRPDNITDVKFIEASSDVMHRLLFLLLKQ